MHRRSAYRLFFALALLLAAAPAHAAPRDNAANQKIDEAVNKYYLATEFDKAETLLKGVLEACEDRCSPAVKAKAWMYVGIVRGSGRQDNDGAKEAFQQAIALDPKVKLDDALATPAVRQAFASLTGGGEPPPEAPPAGPPAAGEMECTPSVREVEAQRPIPVACTTDEPASAVTLRYMAFGGQTWTDVPLSKKGEYWQAEIPCSDTATTGKVRFYVIAKDKEGKQLDSFGSKEQPTDISIVAATPEDPPSYPGQPAPEKCADNACPDDMIGTPACPGTGKGRGSKGWGAPCNTSNECDVGLLCTPGDKGRTCESAPNCSEDSECPSGTSCKGGTCDVSAGGESSEERPSKPGEYRKNLLGLHFGADIAFISGNNVCSTGSDFDCYYKGNESAIPEYIARPYSGTVNGGGVLSTMRVLASYERLLSQRVGLEARIGFAFNGGPKAPNNGAAFLPLHLEGRLKYWFRKEGFSKKGFRPFAFLGGGMAQVDSRITVPVGDCTVPGTNMANPPECPATGLGARPARLHAWKRLGLPFIGIGGGTMFALHERHNIVLNVNLMYMLGSTGVVIEPSLGYEIGL